MITCQGKEYWIFYTPLNYLPKFHMAITKTILLMEYNPLDYFEVPFNYIDEKYSLTVDNGIIEVTLSEPCDIVPRVLRKEISNRIDLIFNARMFSKHERFENGSIMIQKHFADGKVSSDRVIEVKPPSYFISSLFSIFQFV